MPFAILLLAACAPALPRGSGPALADLRALPPGERWKGLPTGAFLTDEGRVLVGAGEGADPASAEASARRALCSSGGPLERLLHVLGERGPGPNLDGAAAFAALSASACPQVASARSAPDGGRFRAIAELQADQAGHLVAKLSEAWSERSRGAADAFSSLSPGRLCGDRPPPAWLGTPSGPVLRDGQRRFVAVGVAAAIGHAGLRRGAAASHARFALARLLDEYLLRLNKDWQASQTAWPLGRLLRTTTVGKPLRGALQQVLPSVSIHAFDVDEECVGRALAEIELVTVLASLIESEDTTPEVRAFLQKRGRAVFDLWLEEKG